MVVALPAEFAGASLEAVGRGETNQAYRLHHQGRDFFVRQASPHSQLLGIDRWQELAAHRIAQSAGLAPALRYADPACGLLICDWIPDPSWESHPPADPVSALAQVAARIHRLPATGLQLLDPVSRLNHYLTGLRQPTQDLVRLCDDVCERWEALPNRAPVLCHNDLHPGNLLGSRPWVLDWEFSALGDPAFELAMLWHNCNLDAASGARLVAAYGAQGNDCSLDRVQALRPMARLLSVLWATLLWEQTGQSRYLAMRRIWLAELCGK